jgi:putative phage-type endonuclease
MEEQSATVTRALQLIAAEYAEQRSDEWLELREHMITASDVASAIGESRYESPDAFVRKKVLRTKWAGNAATEHGTKLEPFVRDLYDRRTGRKSHEIGLVQHREYPWLGASPDGVTEDGILIEIKCPLSRKIEAKVPKHYLPQVQLQLEITDLEECDFIQYRPEEMTTETHDGETLTRVTKPEEYVVVRVKRDREWFATHLPAMKASWDRVVAGRKNGLCELQDDDVPFDFTFKIETRCEILDDPIPFDPFYNGVSVSAQTEDADVPGVQVQLLHEVHSTGGTSVPQVG